MLELLANGIGTAVSTHSRPKAAGGTDKFSTRSKTRFNSQPPEGGWITSTLPLARVTRFNSQPPEGGWYIGQAGRLYRRRFNSQPPEGGWK